MIASETVLNLGLMCFGIYAGVALWTIKQNAVKIARMYLLALLVYSAFDFLLWFNLLEGLRVRMYELGFTQEFNRILQEGIVSSIRSVLYVALWYSYLSKSERVRGTYTDDAKTFEGGEFSTLNLNR